MSVPDRPIKITMICEFFDPALGFQENLLVKYYQKMGHEVTLITSTYRNVFDYYAGRHDKSDPGGVEMLGTARIVRLPFRYNIINKLKSYKGLGQALADASPDMIYVHDVTPDFGVVAKYMKANPACRLIMDFHADYTNSGKSYLSRQVLHGMIRRSFLDKARKHISGYFIIVPDGFDFVEDLYGVAPKDVEFLPLGVDADLIDEIRSEMPRETIRARHGIPADAMVVITGGKLERRKRLELTAEALQRTDDSRIHVIVAGSFPPDDPDYRTLVEERLGDARERIHFAGWLSPEDMYRHMLASDVAFFPASRSVIWLQAIGAGLPLIAGEKGGEALDYVGGHDNILVLEPGQLTPDHVAGVLRDLADDGARRSRMSEGAKRVLRETLDWNFLAKRTLDAAFRTGSKGL